jgi:hypothetical protein
VKSYYEDCDDLTRKRYDVHDCPFCGSKNTDLYQDQVKCERCEALGPRVEDEIWPMAITLWNELPRKQGEELKKLRSHWVNMSRRVRRTEKKAQIAWDKSKRDENAVVERRDCEYRKWAADRAAWLAKPVIKSDA